MVVDVIVLWSLVATNVDAVNLCVPIFLCDSPYPLAASVADIKDLVLEVFIIEVLRRCNDLFLENCVKEVIQFSPLK